MVNSQTMSWIKNFHKNPIKILGVILVLLSLILLLGCHFQVPDFYTNRELADNIAQTVMPMEVDNAVKHLLNPKYDFYNIIFQIWGYFVVAIIFSIIFKIKEFKDFKGIKIFNKKLFVYLWLNFSYIFWCLFYVLGNMIDLYKYVYNGAADSMGIPLFTTIAVLTFIGIIYYPVMNILSFITFNTRIKRKFYIILWVLCLLFLSRVVLDSFTWKFTYFHLILDFIYFVWFFFIIYAIGYMKNKMV